MARRDEFIRQRAAMGFTQESLAELLDVDRTTVGRWERGTLTPLPLCQPRLARALNVSRGELGKLLSTGRANPAEPPDNTSWREPTGEENFVHASIPRLRRALDRLDHSVVVPTRSLVELTNVVSLVTEHRLEARYVEMAATLPELVTELSHATQVSTGEDRLLAHRLLTLALRAADGMAFKYGYLDLSARIIDLMRVTALHADDPLIRATVAYVRTETFFATGDLQTAEYALTKAVDDLLEASVTSVPAMAVHGALHMRAAVVAGRAGRPDTAREHLAEARYMATQAPDGVYLGTAFGPSSVRIHELAVASELKDSGTAVERAGSWSPPPHLPAERRSHYYIELAGAQLDIGRHDDSYKSLEVARQIAPHHTREHPATRRSLAQLVRSHPAPSSGVLALAAWARVR